jgi:hypothetical protein
MQVCMNDTNAVYSVHVTEVNTYHLCGGPCLTRRGKLARAQ